MADTNDINRRDLLKLATATSLGLAFTVREITAEAQGAAKPAAAAADEKPAGAPIGCAVIGLGPQGRELLSSLAKYGAGPIAAVCDTYKAAGFIKRATDIAPKAAVLNDYRQVLERKDVEAVFVATPSHLHKQIVLDALAAGKHVYCEAPLAVDLADAQAIAKAGAAAKTVFQAGLQYRGNKMHNHVLLFLKSDVLGHVAGGRGQWHRRTSWRFAAPTPQREAELNWRLRQESSLGLPGEVGIHSFDTANWYLGALPVAVTAFGGITHWKDGRTVPDTVQCVLEYPNGVQYLYSATLTNSFDGMYDSLMGSKSAILIRDQRAWMFEESDAPMLGWEVYAKKDTKGVGEDNWGTGIALVADSTKQLAAGREPGKIGQDVSKSAFYYSCMSFLRAIRGAKKQGAGPAEAYAANVIAAKVNEAIKSGGRVEIRPEELSLTGVAPRKPSTPAKPAAPARKPAAPATGKGAKTR